MSVLEHRFLRYAAWQARGRKIGDEETGLPSDGRWSFELTWREPEPVS